MTIDLDDLGLTSADLDSLLNERKRPRPEKSKDFLKGPIRWDWLVKAMSLKGKAIHVALFIWRQHFICKSWTVPLKISAMAKLGMHPDTARRALRELENAGLVTVKRSPGRCLVVDLWEVPERPPSTEFSAPPKES